MGTPTVLLPNVLIDISWVDYLTWLQPLTSSRQLYNGENLKYYDPPPPRSSTFIGVQRWQPIKMGHSLHIRGRVGGGSDGWTHPPFYIMIVQRISAISCGTAVRESHHSEEGCWIQGIQSTLNEISQILTKTSMGGKTNCRSSHSLGHVQTSPPDRQTHEMLSNGIRPDYT
jgi:hypothetical protein